LLAVLAAMLGGLALETYLINSIAAWDLSTSRMNLLARLLVYPGEGVSIIIIIIIIVFVKG
jgi:hypothetical protein